MRLEDISSRKIEVYLRGQNEKNKNKKEKAAKKANKGDDELI